jgi:hypothetical protein
MALATPARVALITPLTAGVKLDGVPLSKTKIAEEGQKLSMTAEGEARVMLLGSSKEQVIKGQSSYVISRATLEKDAKVVSRGKISVTTELGNIKKAAALSARAERLTSTDYEPVGLGLVLPPEPTANGWLIKITTPLDQFDITPGNQAKVELKVWRNGKFVQSDTEALLIDQRVDKLELPAELLVEGGRYAMSVTRADNEGYQWEFTVLSRDELDALARTEEALIADIQGDDDLAAKLRLASFYDGVDQLDKMAQVLTEVVDDPQFLKLPRDEGDELLKQLNRARNFTDQKAKQDPRPPQGG